MKEVEILVEVKNKSLNELKEILSKYKYLGQKQVVDEYYYDSLRKDLMPDDTGRLMKCLRIRTKGEKTLLTYKDDIFSGDTWIYSDEFETEVEDKHILEHILQSLGLKHLVTVNNTKDIYKTDIYEIVIEDVEDLGLFIEVECKNNIEDDAVESARIEIRKFISNLGIEVSGELNAGKPELILRKKGRIG